LEKNLKRIRKIAILLIIVAVVLIAFLGLYEKKNGIWKSILPEFNFGMELKGIKELHYVLDDSEEEKEVYIDSEGNVAGEVAKDPNADTQVSLETEDGEKEEANEPDKTDIEGYTKETRTIKANEEANINIDNFEKSKKIIQKRLETLDVYEYNIRLDAVTGEIVIELPDDDNVEIAQSMVSTVGNVEVIDYQTGLILIDNSHIKKAVQLSNYSNGYQSYLQLTFDKEGAEKLKEISNNYQAVTAEDGTETKNYVSIKMDDQTLSTTYFAEELANGTIQIPMGNATEDHNQYMQISQSVERIVKIINEDSMPLSYTLSSDNHINSVVTPELAQNAKIVFLVVIVLVSIYLIIKFKLEGLKCAILCLGHIAILNIILKYTNVIITINAIIAYLAVIVINYAFNISYLKELKNNNKKYIFIKNMKELYLMIIPVCIIAVIFVFVPGVVISSIGMILFWGLFIQAIYNWLILL